MKRINFFELTDLSLHYNPLILSTNFDDKDISFTFYYLYKLSKKIDKDSFPEKSSFIHLNGNISKISFKTGVPFIICALRPPEFFILHKQNKINSPVFLLQHGIFIPFMKRNIKYFYNSFFKMFYYFKSILSLIKESKLSFTPHFFKFFKFTFFEID